jgi:hypothetical protein
VEPITKPIELQNQPPFLLYRNQRSAISGFWFYCTEDCVRIYEVLKRLIRQCNGLDESTSDSNKSMPNSQQQQHLHQRQQQQQQQMNGKVGRDFDIFSMLSKAQAEFNSSGANVEQKLADLQINAQAQHHQPLMKQLSNALPDLTSPNVMNFFAAAQQPNGVGQAPIIHQHPSHFIAPHQVVHQPPVQTLDEIEKHHRVPSISPQSKQIQGECASSLK